MRIYATGAEVNPDGLAQQTSFVMEDDQGVTRKWEIETPVLAGAELQAHLDSRMEEVMCDILRKEYKRASVTQIEGESLYQAWLRWIADGAFNTTEDGVEIVPHTPFQWVEKDVQVARLNREVGEYIYARYDQGTQASFLALMQDARMSQVVKDQITTFWDWTRLVLGYYYQKKQEILTIENWAGVEWDYAQFDALDPQVSLGALMMLQMQAMEAMQQ